MVVIVVVIGVVVVDTIICRYDTRIDRYVTRTYNVCYEDM